MIIYDLHVALPPFSCPIYDTNLNGLYPAADDCNYYYQCAHLVAFRRQCPNGLHFNPSLLICDWPQSAGCRGNNAMQ